MITLPKRIVVVSYCVLLSIGTIACSGKQHYVSLDIEANTFGSIKSDIQSLKDELIDSFSVDETWKKEGLKGYCDESHEYKPISNWAETIAENECDILSLFPVYFNSNFASEEQIEAARNIAVSFTAYIIDEYGLDFYLEVTQIEPYIIAWLSENGLDFTYKDRYASVLSGVYMEEHLFYDYVAHTLNGERIYCKRTDWISTPFELRRFLYEFCEGREAIIEGIKKDAPKTYLHIIDNMPNIIEVFFDDGDNGTQGLAYASRTQIHINEDALPYTVFHELVHCWTYSHYLSMTRWQNEGLAEYFPARYYQPDSIKDLFCNQLMFIEKAVNSDESNMQLLSNDLSFAPYYAYLEKGLSIEREAFDYYLLCQCRAQAELEWANDSLNRQPDIMTIADAYGIPESDEVDGDELSYAMAMSLVAYIIDATNVDCFFFNSIEGTMLTDAYGKGYSELKEEWSNSF